MTPDDRILRPVYAISVVPCSPVRTPTKPFPERLRDIECQAKTFRPIHSYKGQVYNTGKARFGMSQLYEYNLIERRKQRWEGYFTITGPLEILSTCSGQVPH